MAASRTVHLRVDKNTCLRLVSRAASDSSSMQNVVLDACRTLVNEPLRGRTGSGGRPETRRGVPRVRATSLAGQTPPSSN